MANSLASYTTLHYHHVGWYETNFYFLESCGQLISDLGIWCTFLFFTSMHISWMLHLNNFSMVEYLQRQKENAHYVNWEKQDGRISQGRCPWVCLQAGYCTGIDTLAHPLPTIYTQFYIRPLQQLKQYFLSVLFLTLLCFTHQTTKHPTMFKPHFIYNLRLLTYF